MKRSCTGHQQKPQLEHADKIYKVSCKKKVFSPTIHHRWAPLIENDSPIIPRSGSLHSTGHPIDRKYPDELNTRIIIFNYDSLPPKGVCGKNLTFLNLSICTHYIYTPSQYIFRSVCRVLIRSIV